MEWKIWFSGNSTLKLWGIINNDYLSVNGSLLCVTESSRKIILIKTSNEWMWTLFLIEATSTDFLLGIFVDHLFNHDPKMGKEFSVIHSQGVGFNVCIINVRLSWNLCYQCHTKLYWKLTWNRETCSFDFEPIWMGKFVNDIFWRLKSF